MSPPEAVSLEASDSKAAVTADDALRGGARTRRWSVPRLGKHLALLWGLRVSLAKGALGTGWRSLPGAAGAVALASLSVGVAMMAHRVFLLEAVVLDPPLRLFLLLLLGFLASTMWILWPIVTASVDDAAELSRFALFPVSPARLLLASVLASAVEPRTLPLWGALLGAATGFVRGVEGGAGDVAFAVLATLLLALGCATAGRAGLHVLLVILRHRRSAEALGLGLVALLFASLAVPPPDLSWLRNLALNPEAFDSRLLAAATVLFAALPTGGWAAGIAAVTQEAWPRAVAHLVWLVVPTVACGWMALRLLERFHRKVSSTGQRKASRAVGQRYVLRSTFGVLVERELRELLANPRARVMLAMPFFLSILLKLVGARAFLLEVAGPLGDAWLLGAICSYGALVLSAGFGQNLFGYDGPGASLFFATPVRLADVFRAKNAVHAGTAVALACVLASFYRAFLGTPPVWVVAFVFLVAVWQALLLVAVGNVLSVLAPRRFHATMKRRDRPPPLSIAVGLVAAALAVAPGGALLRAVGGPGPMLWLAAGALPVAGALLWWASVPFALRLLDPRRAEVLRTLARQ